MQVSSVYHSSALKSHMAALGEAASQAGFPCGPSPGHGITQAGLRTGPPH